MTVYLVEIDAYDTSPITLRYSSSGYNTKPTDSPSSTHYLGRVISPGNFQRSLFGQGRTYGEAGAGYGVVELNNVDGGLDALIDYGFAGRQIRVKTVEDTTAALSTATTIFSGTVEQPEFDFDTVTFRIRDRMDRLRTPVQETLFAGTTTAGGMNEAEGRPDDLQGKPKPLLFGVGYNIPAVPANVFDLIYQVHDGTLQSVDAVRDQGVALTFAANYSTIALLRAATIPAGQYGTCLAAGLVRLGSSPAGTITVDAKEGSSAAARTAGQVTARIMAKIGLTTGDYSSPSITALDAANSAEVGLWIGPDVTDALSVIGRVLGSVGASITPDANGIFEVARLVAPTGTPVAEYDITVIDNGAPLERIATGDDGAGVPCWRVFLKYKPVWQVQGGGDLAASVSAANAALWGAEYRQVSATDTAVLTKYPEAPEMAFETLLVSDGAAQAEANRLRDLYKVRRDYFRVPVPAEVGRTHKLGDVIQIKFERFGLSAGKLFTVLGVVNEFAAGLIELEVWG